MAKPNTRALRVALGLVAAAACGEKSEAERARDLAACSAVESAADLIARCLVDKHGWEDAPARRVGLIRAQALDSIQAWQEDSAWQSDSVQHRADVRACSGGDRMRACLRLRGWPDARALATADALWRQDATRHLREIRACLRQREGPVASCLVLRYQWSNDRALATQDSVRRAQLAR